MNFLNFLLQTPAVPPATTPAVPAITRLRGAFLVVFGAILAVSCGIISVIMLTLLLAPGYAQDGTTFDGTTEQGIYAAVMIPFVSVFGAMFVIGGLQLYKTGRYSKRFGYVGGAMAVIFVALLHLGRQLF